MKGLEFAGRIEKVFKKLHGQIPERYLDKLLLKDRLFHGMNQHLKDSLRYLYTQSSMTYANLLQAAYAAEVEAEKGRAARSKAANLANSPDKVDIRSRDPSPIVASVATMESKLDKCLKAVSKVAQAPVNKIETSQQKGPHRKITLAQLPQLNIRVQPLQQQVHSKVRMVNQFNAGIMGGGDTLLESALLRETSTGGN